MVAPEEEIAHRLEDKDSARSAGRKQAATTIGELARRHTALASQLAELERELGEVLTAAGDVIDIAELAEVTDIPAADLTRWRDQAKPARGGKRKGTTPKKNTPTKKNEITATTMTSAASSAAVAATPTMAPVGAAST
ncbi:hypothetical protein [Amycolatopsis taiwanensis]|uniref:Uncharacterized protein n=1 Tax=Amycolatopsis taiwanensis TaxID=342230 RepID=A0A9W6R729_9PSEU|nr:hypothetical protein [Amycolatopsis taiwanensis]GLY68742.1 hypothetical protein Atai01_53610 [Amycolatopsis taiwanensis]